MMAEVLDAGVNHVDVALTYGDAERKLAPILEAAQAFEPLSADQQEALVEDGGDGSSPVPRH